MTVLGASETLRPRFFEAEVGEGGVQAIRSMLVLCLVRLGAHLLVAVGITISNDVIAIGGAVTALAGIATG